MARRHALRSTRERLLLFLTVAAIAEVLWAIYLGWTLPRHYVANHWVLAWVGLDVGEIAMLFATAWAAWRQRAVLILFAIVLATLLLVDAWFDVTTARQGDFLQSLLLAIFAEVPLSLLLFWTAWRAARRLVATHLDNGKLVATKVRQVTLLPPEND
ncbi:MAG: hypothetical protein WAK12_10375 [Acidimicrobiales bacterium]